jgi:hypothetical protein
MGEEIMTKKAFIQLFVGSLGIAYAIMLSLSCGSPGSLGSGSTGGGSGGIGSGSTGGGGSGGSVVINPNAGSIGTGSGGSAGSTVPSANAGTCGTTTTDTTRAGADVLIVLDRTSSMTQSMSVDSPCSANDPSCTTRLAAIVPAVGEVVANNPGIQWGIELFTTPGGGQCVVSAAPEVTIAPDNAAAINSVLGSLTTEQSTPTARALQVATDYLRTVNDNNNKAILLATDGEPNCANATTSGSDLAGATAAATAAKNAGFSVYVIGIGPSVSNLDALAKAGGTGNYYPATSVSALNTALSAIAKVVSATCTFKANATPPDKNLVYVYVDKDLVTSSGSNGWTFDTSDPTYSTITLTGSYCSDMLAGVTTQVQIVFGCPNTLPPSVIQ